MRFALSCLLLLLTASGAAAQFDSATVVGTVRDTTGAVVPAATVTLTGVETGISVTRLSGENGGFEFPAVRPGRYVVTAEKTGFALAMVENVVVQVGARLRVDLQMPVGGVSEKVEVTAASPLMETDSSQRGQVISGQSWLISWMTRRGKIANAIRTTRPRDKGTKGLLTKGLPDKGTTGPRDNGTTLSRTTGLLDNGTTGLWSFGPLVLWSGSRSSA